MSASDDGKNPQAKDASADDKAKDDDVDNVLNAALEDFNLKGDQQGGASASGGVGSAMADMMPPFLSQEAAQQAAADFQNMLKQLAKVQEEANKHPIPDGGSSAAATAGEVAPSDDADQAALMKEQEEMAAQFLNNLKEMQEKAGKVAESQNPDDFFKTMEDFQQAGFQNDFMPFMHGLMTSLLSKEMMYPSLKEMVEKYPKWLDDNASSLSADDQQRYAGQLECMKELVSLYDAESPSDADDVKMQRFDKIMMSMQKMQACGHPPAELVGDMPPGWDFDPTSGLPTVNDPAAAAENGCSVM